MEDNFRKDLEKMIKAFEGSSVEVINQELQKLTDKYNNTGMAEFDGLSPEQMKGLVYFNCGENMIKIKDAKGSDIPLVKQVSYFLDIVDAEKEIKLTKAGYLPPSIVKELYSQKFLSDFLVETGLKKLTKETDAQPIELTTVLCRVGGLTKKRNGILSLTDYGRKLAATKNYLPAILTTYCSKLNWTYFDRFREDEEIGQLGCYYSIYLLNKYGDIKREAGFYANKYFKAFFKEYIGINTMQHLCYSVRTFNRFAKYFGFIEYYEENKLMTTYVKKSDLFDKYIEIQ
jgi:hypothetical protein